MPSTSRSLVAILCGILVACSAASSPETCGNGIVEGQETCDDGNRRDGDGCSATCQVEPPAKIDCAGTQGGAAFLDHCNQCVGGTTGQTACAQDCAGVFGGQAAIDHCGQ